MTCPAPEVLGRFVDGSLDDAGRSPIEEHLEDCDDCRSVAAMLVKIVSRPATDALDVTAVASTVRRTTGLDDTAADPGARTTPQSRPSILPVDTKFDRYVVRRVLGQGGMGIVYAAHDPALARDVAIKVLRSDFARSDPDAARRIAREAQVMARISDPNVIAVFDVGTHDGKVFIAMELVVGVNLRAWLTSAERTVAAILEVFVSAGRGLIAAHNAGIIHRDFKPDNVLVGDDGRVRVTDFGIARERATAAIDDTREPERSGIAGTPGYMAPEQFEGGNTDARTDQFSFCAALYEALYGKRPFRGTSFAALADAVTAGRIEPVPAGSRIPSSLHAILVRGLAVDPAARFPTLADLLRALSRDRARRPRRVAFAAVVALVCVAVGLTADWVVRDRVTAVTRTSFAATRAQLDKLVALRSEAFVAQADALYAQGPVQAIAATRSDADFGLGSPADDHERFAKIHDTLVAATWVRLARSGPGYELAIADEKGQLLYNSATPSRWGTRVTSVPAIGFAYDTTTDTSIGVVRANDPVVVASGVLGDGGLTGLYVVFARVRLGPNGQPQASFAQMIPSAELLGEVSVGDDGGDTPTQLSIVAPDGTIEGTVPPALANQIASDDLAEVTVDGATWFVQRVPLRAPGQRAGVSRFVLARRADLLFPHTREILALVAALLALVAIGGVALGRSRDLDRRIA